jgi:1,4-dihydroxy-2-naphthoate octaprenyltransferase
MMMVDAGIVASIVITQMAHVSLLMTIVAYVAHRNVHHVMKQNASPARLVPILKVDLVFVTVSSSTVMDLETA